MLSLANWIAYGVGEQSPNMIVLMAISPSAVGIASDFFMSGSDQVVDKDLSAYQDYIQNIHSVTPIAPQIDPITRKTKTSKMTVTLVDDGSVREFVNDTAHIYFGAEVTLLWAHADNPATTAPLWKGLLVDVVPARGFIEIRCENLISTLEGKFYYGSWWGNHPLELAQHILESVGNIPTAKIDTTSFNPATDTGISHYVVGETVAADGVVALSSYVRPDSTADAQYMLDGLMLSMYGSIITHEDGKVTFKRFDATDASVATWTGRDIISVSQKASFGNIVNRVVLNIGLAPPQGYMTTAQVDATENAAARYVINDTASQSRYGIAAGDDGVHEFRMDLAFVPGRLKQVRDLSAASTTNFDLENWGVGTMSGSRMSSIFEGDVPLPPPQWSTINAGAWSQDADAVVSAARPLYLLFRNEVVKATSITFSTASNKQAGVTRRDKDGEFTTRGEYIPWKCTLGGVDRGPGAVQYYQYEKYYVSLWDITAPFNAARAILDRAANGIPILDVTTTIAQYAVQLGDLVVLEDPDPLLFGSDGLDSSNIIKWEVIGKEVDPLATPATIRWRLALAAYTSDPWTKTIADDPLLPGQPLPVNGLWYQAAAGTAIPSATWTVMSYDTILVYPQYGTWSGSSYTVENPGHYRLAAKVNIDSVQGEQYIQCRITVNGAVVEEGAKVYQGGGVDTNASVAAVALAFEELSWGDIVRVEVYQSDIVSRNVLPGDTRTSLYIRQLD